MKLSEMIYRTRRRLPSATIESVSDQEIIGELNRGVDECNRLAQCYLGYTEFPSVIGKQIYSLSGDVPRYLAISKDGCWFKATTSFKELFPKTIRWLDLFIRNWRDLGNAEPQWYWVQGNDLGLYPKPNVVGTLRVYHLKNSIPMDNLNNYPWENTTNEITALQGFDDAIVAYACWKIAPAVGQTGLENPYYAEFVREVHKGQTQTRRRPDISSHWDNYIRLDQNAV